MYSYTCDLVTYRWIVVVFACIHVHTLFKLEVVVLLYSERVVGGGMGLCVLYI